jgi:F-type H+-transporting ATPase subunit delta
MRQTTIARNYAEALLALATKAGDLDGWGTTIGALADVLQGDRTLANFLAAPQIAAVDKNRVLGKALAGKVPPLLLRFVQKVVENRRQLLIGEIATEYGNLVDDRAGRVHATVTVAREASAADRALIAERLSKALGKEVVPHLRLNPAIIGGLVVKVGDTVMDGSVRRRLSLLRGQLLATR